VSDFVAAGGSLAVFGANTCWWQASVADGRMAVRKDRDDSLDGPGLWWRCGAPENELLGLSYRNGGGWWAGARPAAPYRVTRPDDPLLAGVDLDEFQALPHLAGYEVDGHAYVLGTPRGSTRSVALPGLAGAGVGAAPVRARLRLGPSGPRVRQLGTGCRVDRVLPARDVTGLQRGHHRLGGPPTRPFGRTHHAQRPQRGRRSADPG